MTINSSGAGASRAVLIFRLLGLGLYITAFFLPACREAVGIGSDAPAVFRGYTCAWVTVVNTLSTEVWRSKEVLAILSGWINPLLLLYLVSLLSDRMRWPRRIVASAILLFIGGTWVYFSLAHLVPLVGHYLWIAGILMVLSGEVMGREVSDQGQP